MSKQIDISKNYITIQGFMVEKLHLTGNELILYALIYGFSQATDNEFSGSLSYITKWLGCSKPTVIKLLKKLCDNKLIIKNEEYNNNVKFCTYSCNLNTINQDTTDFTSGKETLPPVNNQEKSDNEGVVKKFNHQLKNLNGGSKETLPPVKNEEENNNEGVVKKFNHRLNNLNGGGKETLPNNINNNIYIDDMIDKIDIARMREKIKEQIEYSFYEKNFNADISCIDTIVEIMLEGSLADSEKQSTIYGFNTELFQERISKINSTHIDYILECMGRAQDIKNIKAYLTKTVFNAPATIDAYYKSETNYKKSSPKIKKINF